MDAEMSGFCIKSRGDSGGGTKCGRWNPTTEQVKVLTDLFKSGLRTPSTNQIQKISSQLSFYGKIESKNVFYWFQNHKARERHKRRKFKVSVDDQHEVHQKEKIPFKNFAEINQLSERERVVETLQLFPLNSFGESEQEKLRLFAIECKDTRSFSHTIGTGSMDHQPLDLRLSTM